MQMILGKRRFNSADQMRFASLSGDCNPMHMDPLQARRTQAGAPVVHGIHLLLWALDRFAETQSDLPSLSDIRVHFNKFAYLEECVEVVLTKRSPSGARLSISVDGSPRSTVTLTFGPSTEDCPAWSGLPLRLFPSLPEPLNLNFAQMSELSGRLPFVATPEDAAAMFPAATKWLGARRIAALCSSTHLVGMICPGLHSIYSELSVRICAESTARDFLAFRVTEMDPRFRLVDQEIAGGGLTGTVYSASRMPPVEQASMKELKGLVAAEEFAGTVALIVGGSRGLGELTAKLIATGGGRVLVTWQTGKDDAERVAQEIQFAGGMCETLAYDARKPAAEQLALLADAPTHAYYFATPAIFRSQSEMFVRKRLEEFLAIYVNGFWQLLHALHARQPKLSAFYPSSVSVAERPQGMTEYTMAKSAGEVLCADMNVSLAPLHVTVSRLPRLLTDQTATSAATETAHPVETMLSIIREVQSWPK
jgi:NAD(P)-dependent dehydrogenase (short-subunit alcohol dehydrogenase family)